MATITGLKVLGRECAPGDEVMNEWTGQVMTVVGVETIYGEHIKLHCKKVDGRLETIEGNWDATTRLVTRKTTQYEPELTSDEIAMLNTVKVEAQNAHDNCLHKYGKLFCDGKAVEFVGCNQQTYVIDIANTGVRREFYLWIDHKRVDIEANHPLDFAEYQASHK